MAQRLTASGAGPADEGVEGGHRRRRHGARILVRRARQAAERRKWDDDSRPSPSGSAQLDGVSGEIIEPTGVDKVPRLKIIWDRGRYPLDGTGLRLAVLDGEPRIMLDDNSASEDAIAVDPFQLQPGEAAQVGDAVVAALRASLTNRPPATRAPAPTSPANGSCASRSCTARAPTVSRSNSTGGDMAGHQRSPQFEGPVDGEIEPTGYDSRSPAVTKRRRSRTASRARSRTARCPAR